MPLAYQLYLLAPLAHIIQLNMDWNFIITNPEIFMRTLKGRIQIQKMILVSERNWIKVSLNFITNQEASLMRWESFEMQNIIVNFKPYFITDKYY